jgi:hypothetical protein
MGERGGNGERKKTEKVRNTDERTEAAGKKNRRPASFQRGEKKKEK